MRSIREFLGRTLLAEGGRDAASAGPKTVSDLFDAVYVINLDRREDRWARMQTRLDRAGIAAERWPAIDGKMPEVEALYQAHLDAHPRHPGRPEATLDLSLYRSGDHAARVDALSDAWGGPTLNSAGSLAYLMSWCALLEQSIAKGHRAILVLEDDVVFRRDFASAFEQAAARLPADWAVLQLGTLRPRRLPRRRWWSRHLFMNEGYSVGSHAVGLSERVLPEMLDLVRRRDCVIDDGALSTLTWRHRDRAFVTLPDLAIQDMADSDIGNDRQADFARFAKRYRWNLADYDF
ncbi:MAG: glycosyltransferase family 25 protein [Rubricella sp.]